MINYIDIKGWEGHTHSYLEFPPGVSVLIGPTDAGKSAVLRALMGVAFNRPLDKSVINDKAKEYAVTLGLTEGREITRTRNQSGNKNTYEMDGSIYKAFGHNPPEDVQTTLNLDHDLNIQAQIDPIFLIQSSPGEVARHFNESAGLDEIDKSMSSLHSRERKLKSEVQQHETRTKELQEQLERYAGLEEVEGKLSELEQEQVHLDQLRQKREQIKQHTDRVWQAQKKAEQYRKKTRLQGSVQECLDLQEQIKTKKQEREEIKRQVDRVQQAQRKVEQYRKKTELRDPVQECLNLVEHIEAKKQERRDWQDLTAKTRKVNKAVDKARKGLQKFYTEWEENAPDTCPLCDGEGRLK